MTQDILTVTPEAAQGNPRAASVRLKARTLSQAYGQRRHDFRNGPQPDYVDGSRSDLNRYLMHPRPLPEIKREIVALRKTAGAKREIKSNACIVTAGIITFGQEAQVLFATLTPDQQNAAFRDLAQAIADRLQTSLEALTIHLDESALHAHFEIRGYSDLGQPISKLATWGVMSELQDMTTGTMSKHCLGIERGNKKWDRIAAGADFSETVNRSVKELHRDLPIEIAAKKKELLDVEKRIQDLLILEEKDRGRVAKLEANELLNAEEAEQLKDYRARLDNIQNELVALGSQIDGQKVAISQMTKGLDIRAADQDSREVAQEHRTHDQDKREKAQDEREAALESREAEIEGSVHKAACEAAAVAARAIADVVMGKIYKTENTWQVPSSDRPVLRPIWKAIVPALNAISLWWANAQEKISALSNYDRNALMTSILPPEDPTDDTDFGL